MWATGGMAEECSICTDPLGVPGQPAASLPCGHVFCCSCLREWTALRHIECPQCRASFRPERDERVLCPWRDGLRLKQTTSAEQEALTGLEDARGQRQAMEQRALTAERALRRRTATVAMAGGAPPSCVGASRVAASSEQPRSEQVAEASAACAGAPMAGAPPYCVGSASPSVAASSEQPRPEQPRPEHIAEGVGAIVGAPTPAALDAAAVTEAQRQRAAASRAAALARRQEREAAQQMTAPISKSARCDGCLTSATCESAATGGGAAGDDAHGAPGAARCTGTSGASGSTDALLLIGRAISDVPLNKV